MTSVSGPSSIPQSKNHYEALDGLRGVAALLVVAFHTLEPNDHGIRFNQIINHGYLAVDFFFLLSGFVVAYAYDDRWSRMSQWDFYKRRLIRLQPMIVMGSLIGAAFFYFQRGSAFPLIAATPWWKMLAVMLFGCTLLPLPIRYDIRGWDEMHPLDGPAWSLFFEYVANILYAVWLRKLATRWLSLLTGLSAIFLIHMLVTGEGDAIGGWALNAAQLHIGFARLLFPFLAGILLMRSGKRIHLRHGFYICSVLLLICFALPRFGGPDHLWINGLYEAVCIIARVSGDRRHWGRESSGQHLYLTGSAALWAISLTRSTSRTIPSSISTPPGLRNVRIALLSEPDGAFFSGLRPWPSGTPASNSTTNPSAPG